MRRPEVGKPWWSKRVRELRELSNGWFVIKTDDSKSPKDFKVRLVYVDREGKQRTTTPKHAHFAVDLYGKICRDEDKAKLVFKAIVEVWQGRDYRDVWERYKNETKSLPGYPLDYILAALDWILEQEDINYLQKRPERFQRELDEVLQRVGVKTPPGREGSQLAVALLAYIILGLHPVEALTKAQLDILPRRKF